jgi:hypothetical protein
MSWRRRACVLIQEFYVSVWHALTTSHRTILHIFDAPLLGLWLPRPGVGAVGDDRGAPIIASSYSSTRRPAQRSPTARAGQYNVGDSLRPRYRAPPAMQCAIRTRHIRQWMTSSSTSYGLMMLVGEACPRRRQRGLRCGHGIRRQGASLRRAVRISTDEGRARPGRSQLHAGGRLPRPRARSGRP